MPFKLHRPPELTNFTAKGARMRIQQTRNLHGQRAAPGDNLTGRQILPGGAQHRERIHAWMLPEPAIFILDQGLKIARRDLFNRDRITPDPFAVGKTPERRALLIDHHPGGVNLFQRQRPEAVGGDNQPP